MLAQKNNNCKQIQQTHPLEASQALASGVLAAGRPLRRSHASAPGKGLRLCLRMFGGGKLSATSSLAQRESQSPRTRRHRSAFPRCGRDWRGSATWDGCESVAVLREVSGRGGISGRHVPRVSVVQSGVKGLTCTGKTKRTRPGPEQSCLLD